MDQNGILTSLSKQNNEAYRYLYQQFYIGLKAVANYYTRNEQTAEDLVQEVFISLLEIKQRFNTLNDVKYFLYSMLKNKCLNHLRNQKIRDKHHNEIFIQNKDIDNYWEQVLKEDVYSTLYNAIQSLPPQCRQVMLLSLEGKKISEIADKLHISPDTVKEYRSNGKKKLLTLLEGKEIALLLTWLWI